MEQDKDNNCSTSNDEIKFHKILEEGYPKKPGRYLVKFFDEENNWLPDYSVLYFKEFEDLNGEKKMGFFLNETCPSSAGFEGPVFHNRVFEYVELTNLLS